MNVQLIRHARTLGNEQKRYIGCTDESLSPLGRHELLEWANAGIYRPVNAVFSSPMSRCLETAALIFPQAAPVVVPQLMECDFGAFEGKTYEQLKGDANYRLWLETNGRAPIPCGENPTEFRRRSCEGFEQVMDASFTADFSSVAVILHGGSIMAILERFAPGGDFYRWQAPNCGGFRLETEENFWRENRRTDMPEPILSGTLPKAVDKPQKEPL
ncbi:MAG: histidine phosphatase family protein [Clostridia bacterium]|nr:histidine phosphatase family protein [Clostridia bacterium]